MAVRLVVTEGKHTGQEFVLEDRGSYELGSGPRLPISIDDSQVAAVHCRILKTKDDRFAIRDVSGRGVFVNDKKVIHTWLDDEDLIRVGATCLQFVKSLPGWAVPSPLVPPPRPAEPRPSDIPPRPARSAAAPPHHGVSRSSDPLHNSADFHMPLNALQEARHVPSEQAEALAGDAGGPDSSPEDIWQRPGQRKDGFILKVLEGKVTGKLHTVNDTRSTLIGRGLSADIPVLDHKASRNHCRLDVVDKEVFLTDLGSTNGVRVNGVRVERVRLKPGDRMRIGSTIFLFTPASQSWDAPLGDQEDVRTPSRPMLQARKADAPLDDDSSHGGFQRDNGSRPPSPSDPPLVEIHHARVEGSEAVRPAAVKSRKKRSYVEIGVQSGFWSIPSPDPSKEVAIFPGRVLQERYEIRRHLRPKRDSGVFLARDLKTDRESAIKLFQPKLLRSDEAVKNFIKALSGCTGLRHKNAVAIREVGQDPESGLLYLVMDVYEGVTLTEVLAERGKLPVGEAVSLACQILEALSYAHKRDVLHRDLSPGNILIQQGERLHVRVQHFGVVQALSQVIERQGQILVGTPGYMSLEHISGKDVGPESDIFSVGVLLYRMLSGRLPWEGDQPVQLSFALVEEDPYPLEELVPKLEPKLVDLVHKALQRDPMARFRTAREFASELQTVFESTDVLKKVESVRAPRSWKPWVLVPLAVLVCLAGLWGLAMWLDLFRPGNPAVLTASEAELPVGILLRRESWNDASHQAQDKVIDEVAGALGDSYEHVATKVYQNGGLSHRIGVFRHLPTGMLLHLVPGTRAIPPFLIARHELKQNEWDALGGELDLVDARFFATGEDLPLERVAVRDLAGYLQLTRLRLPRLSEWQHVALAGAEGPTFWGEQDGSSFCWSETNAGGRARATSEHFGYGNAFGLIDVLGNLEELALGDAGPVRCGGSWASLQGECGAHAWRPIPADARSFTVGARLCRDLPASLLQPDGD